VSLTLETLNIHHPTVYATEGSPWAAWDLLRERAPVYWYERDDVEPFWAVTRYADIMTVSDHAQVFINGGPRLRLTLKGTPEILRAGVDTFGEERGWDPAEPPDMVFMDNPRHRQLRRQSSWAFTQGGMRRMDAHFRTLAEQFDNLQTVEMRKLADQFRFCNRVVFADLVERKFVQDADRDEQQDHIVRDLLLLRDTQGFGLRMPGTQHCGEIGNFHTHELTDLIEPLQRQLIAGKQSLHAGFRESERRGDIAVGEAVRLQCLLQGVDQQYGLCH
jgi:cytochrome P450